MLNINLEIREQSLIFKYNKKIKRIWQLKIIIGRQN